MRSLQNTELTAVAGGLTLPSKAPTAAQIAAAKAALAAKGITITLDMAAGTATIHTLKGDKVVNLPAKALDYIKSHNITGI